MKSNKLKYFFFFTFIWIFFFFIILFSEYFIFVSDGQMITSSGDVIYRQHWLSLIIGYGFIVFFFVYTNSVVLKRVKYVFLLSSALFLLSVLIFIKNQQLLVHSSNGERYVELFTPFYEHEEIGCFIDINTELSRKYKNKNISKYYTENNKIVFERPLLKDYIITKQFLFWRFSFPNENYTIQ